VLSMCRYRVALIVAVGVRPSGQIKPLRKADSVISAVASASEKARGLRWQRRDRSRVRGNVISIMPDAARALSRPPPFVRKPLLVQGVSPRVVMEVLGHSETALTMNAIATWCRNSSERRHNRCRRFLSTSPKPLKGHPL
jgi:hypothetical protein